MLEEKVEEEMVLFAACFKNRSKKNRDMFSFLFFVFFEFLKQAKKNSMVRFWRTAQKTLFSCC